MEDYVERLEDLRDQLMALLDEMEESGVITENMAADIEVLFAASDALETAIEGLSPMSERPASDPAEEDPEDAEEDAAAKPAKPAK